MPLPANKGNSIIRLAFAGERGERDTRARALRRVLHPLAMSTVYQMMEEVSDFGSGTPSPLHKVCEIVALAEELDRGEKSEVSYAQMIADYPAFYLRQLRGEAGDADTDADAASKMKFLLKSAADASYMVGSRDLKDLPPCELGEYSQLMMYVSAVALELSGLADKQAARKTASYPGAPMPRENVAAG